jgi:outer membrane protein assembly factor BamB
MRRRLAEVLVAILVAVGLVAVIGAGRVLGSRRDAGGPPAQAAIAPAPMTVAPATVGPPAVATAPALQPVAVPVPSATPTLPALPTLAPVRLPTISLPPLLPRPAYPPPSAGDWSEYRYDSAQGGYDGAETVLGAAQLGATRQRWFGYTLSGPPVVVGGVVYAGRFSSIAAYPLGGCGADQCSPSWSYDLGNAPNSYANQVTGAPAVAQGRVLATVNLSDEGWLYAFSAAGCGSVSCHPLWRAQVTHKQTVAGGGTTGRSLAGPVVSGGTVFTASSDTSGLRAFAVAGCGVAVCQPLWTGTMGDGLVGAPAVAGGTVFAASEDGHLYAFRAAGCGAPTCSPLWSTDLHRTVMSTPAVAGSRVYVTTMDGVVHAVDASGGAEAWSVSTGATDLRSSPTVAGATVLVGAPSGLEALDASSGSLLWTGGTGGTAAWASATGADGVVYAYDGGTLYAFHAAGCGMPHCTAFWTLPTGATQAIGSDGPVVVDGRLVLRADDQRLLVIG